MVDLYNVLNSCLDSARGGSPAAHPGAADDARAREAAAERMMFVSSGFGLGAPSDAGSVFESVATVAENSVCTAGRSRLHRAAVETNLGDSPSGAVLRFDPAGIQVGSPDLQTFVRTYVALGELALFPPILPYMGRRGFRDQDARAPSLVRFYDLRCPPGRSLQSGHPPTSRDTRMKLPQLLSGFLKRRIVDFENFPNGLI